MNVNLKSIKYLFPVLLCLSVPAAVIAGAPVDEMTTIRSEYAAGKISEVVPQLVAFLQLAPNHSEARYYLGLCYLRQNKLDLAQIEFEASLQHTNDPTIRKYCEEALKEVASASPSAASSSPGDAATNSTVSESAKSLAEIDSRVSAEKERIMREAQAEIDAIDREAARKCREVEMEAPDRYYDYFPDYSYMAANYRRGQRYALMNAIISAYTRDQQAKIRSEAERRKAPILPAAEARAKGLDQTVEIVRQNVSAPNPHIHMVPTTKSMYVRNYVNDGESAERH